MNKQLFAKQSAVGITVIARLVLNAVKELPEFSGDDEAISSHFL